MPNQQERARKNIIKYNSIGKVNEGLHQKKKTPLANGLSANLGEGANDKREIIHLKGEGVYLKYHGKTGVGCEQ